MLGGSSSAGGSACEKIGGGAVLGGGLGGSGWPLKFTVSLSRVTYGIQSIQMESEGFRRTDSRIRRVRALTASFPTR
jgi:hypothetical protein